MNVKTPPRSPTPQLKIMPTDMEEVKSARDFVGDALIGLGVDAETAFTAKVIVSELVTNAIKHTESASILVRTYIAQDGLAVVEVDDESDARPQIRPITLDALTGRGLAIIAENAACWGWVLREGSGKTVWAGLKSG
ncbi:ATP-binding protein [Actinomadura rupiterrae]|uniref:ATP-binding protein n=1 Tax=Actinomadura rupiterrae TaxID=559627 RepID=UPI0020A44B68|nr:ATP-binding protein [Actinomadura rupiterrae]MCP2342543.1 anti-sigma regulatory factor (Ser/Thr protein kinase) [Actinomadura rupiterrae]